jgi:hypothetical protein
VVTAATTGHKKSKRITGMRRGLRRGGLLAGWDYCVVHTNRRSVVVHRIGTAPQLYLLLSKSVVICILPNRGM